jgi:hypothetical protein
VGRSADYLFEILWRLPAMTGAGLFLSHQLRCRRPPPALLEPGARGLGHGRGRFSLIPTFSMIASPPDVASRSTLLIDQGGGGPGNRRHVPDIVGWSSTCRRWR